MLYFVGSPLANKLAKSTYHYMALLSVKGIEVEFKLACQLEIINVLKNECVLISLEFLVFILLKRKFVNRTSLSLNADRRQRISLDEDSLRAIVK